MAEQLTLTWIGHSCFKLDRGDYTVVFDPYEDGYVPGCPLVRESADLVLCSHDHKDHGASHLVKRIEGRKNPFQIQVIHTWHDDQKGALRGRNQIHILDDGTFRMAHMGDLGCKLTVEEMKQLRGLDLMLIPVGGYYTIDAKQAKALVEQVKPRIVVPMHYRGEGFGYDVLGTVKDYTDLCETCLLYTSYFSIAIRSRPMPKANPLYFSESMPQFSNTFLFTTPAPKTSIQPVSLHSLQPLPPHWKQLTSTSTDGSVNGK